MKNMNRFQAVLLCLVLLILMSFWPVPAKADSGTSFSDVLPNDWFAQYTLILQERGIIQGFPDGSFRPHIPIIRKHAAKMIALSAGLDTTEPPISFPDFPSTDAMAPYVAALVKSGAIQGFPDGSFRPNAHITRGHACKMIVHAFQLPHPPAQIPFVDYPQDPGVSYAISTLGAYGYVKGYSTENGPEFRPNNNLTRAQMAKILCLCMAHNAVDKAVYSESLADAEAALELVDALPDDQDAVLKEAFTERLLAILDPLKEGLYGFAYWRDVETINRLINNNSLDWAVWQPGSVQPPPSWDITDWTNEPPFRMTLLEMDNAGLTGSANLSPLSELETLSLSGNPGLTDIKVRGCKHLISLSCKNSGLRSLDLTGLDALFWLNCSGNLDLQTLILDGCSAVGLLYCDICNLSSLDLSSLGGIHTLFCENNQLTSLNLLANTQLERISCIGNQLTSMVLCPTAVYEGIDVRFNKMKGTSSIVNGSHLPWDTDPLFLFSPQN